MIDVESMTPIGRGTSRDVYDLDTSRVLKLASGSYNRLMKGLAQNRTEYEIYEKAQYDSLTCLCPVYKISSSDEQLIMAKAIPITRTDLIPDEAREKVRELKRRLKYFDQAIHEVRKHEINTARIVRQLPKHRQDEAKRAFRSKMFDDLKILHYHYDLALGDLIRPSSWGYYKGRFVLIDYGATWEVLREWYNYRS